MSPPGRIQGHRPAPRGAPSTSALFVRIPAEQAQRLDRAAFALKLPKQRLISGLLERYVDPDSADSLDALSGAEEGGRRVTVETFGEDPLAVGHHHFRPREADVLTAVEAGELLQVEVEVIERLAQDGELPGRRLGGQWRFARVALLSWLGAPGAAAPTAPDRADPAAGER